MNERIKELAEQATSIVEMVGPEGYTSSYAKFDKEKFAQLIIRECMRMCDCADVSYLEHGCDKEASGAAGAKEIIKEWFEVEE
jgi:hypothetical protein